MFGIALDGGTDQVLGEHIMVAVLYVGPHHWVLPPMYHEKHGAFNGVQIGAQIVDDLRRRLGAQRLRKWAYFIVDGAAVNHVARQEAENELGELYRRLGILGESDFSSMRNAVQGSIAQRTLYSAVGAGDMHRPFSQPSCEVGTKELEHYEPLSTS